MIRMFTLAANDARQTNEQAKITFSLLVSPTSNTEYTAADSCLRVVYAHTANSKTQVCVYACLFASYCCTQKIHRHSWKYDAKMNNNCDA